MTRTFSTVIDDPEAEHILSRFGEVMAKARHWSFKQIHVLHRPLSVVKKEAIARFGITSRQFNGLRFDLDQAVNSWKGTTVWTVQRLTDSIEATGERITLLLKQMDKARTEKRREYLRGLLAMKRQRLDVLKGELNVAEREVAEDRPRICFGGRKLLRHANRQGEVPWEWREERKNSILLVGSADESGGNQGCQWDGDKLRLKLPPALGGGLVTLENVLFRYGQAEMLRIAQDNAASLPPAPTKQQRETLASEALEAICTRRTQAMVKRTALTWLLFRDEQGRWHAHVTVDEAMPKVVTSKANGVVAVDLNVDHLAVTIVDRHGNPTSRLTLVFPSAGTPEGRAAVIIGDSIRALCLLALSRGMGIACESLDFSRKKAGLREYGPCHARRLSGWAYARFFKMLSARCKRDGVELTAVNPAFTSIIGGLKYARGRAMSRHHAAALVIGRRAMEYGERLVDMSGSILDSPARMRPRTEWSRWRGVRRLPQEAARKRVAVRTARSGVGGAGTGGRAATQRPAAGAHGVRRRSTATAPLQVGDAVALATREAPQG